MAILIRSTHTTSGTSTRFPSRVSAIQLVCQIGGSEESPKCGLLRCVGLILTNIRSRKVPIIVSESSKFLWDAATVESRERERSHPHSGPHSGPPGSRSRHLGIKRNLRTVVVGRSRCAHRLLARKRVVSCRSGLVVSQKYEA